MAVTGVWVVQMCAAVGDDGETRADGGQGFGLQWVLGPPPHLCHDDIFNVCEAAVLLGPWGCGLQL